VDIGCLVTFITSLISGLVLYLVLPSGGGRGGGSGSYLGIAREQWLNMHNYTSLIFAALIIIHLLLHWMYFRNIRKCFITKQKT
jgi:preprotein translocase subunit SecG